MPGAVRERNEREIPQLRLATQRRIAALMGIGESTLSTLKNDHMVKVQVGLQRVQPKRGEA